MEWRRRPLFYAAILLSLLIFLWFNLPFNSISHKQGPFSPYVGMGPVFVGGKIVSDVESRLSFGRQRQVFVLGIEKVWTDTKSKPALIKDKAKVYVEGSSDLAYGDILVLQGDLEAPSGVRNPGGFDQRAYLDRQGIHGLFFAAKGVSLKVLKRGQGNIIFEHALKIRRALSNILSAEFSPRDAAFLKALFLGERAGLDENFKDLFVKTGTMHILAVSGFNIGFLLFGVLLLLRPLPLSVNFKLWAALVSVWLYCVIVGWQAPVVRASLMASLLLTGKLVGRKVDALNALGLAALIILAIQPKQLFDVGFQLSFMAVFAIVAAVPVFLKRPELWPNESLLFEEKGLFYVQELFWISFVCLFATLPVTVQNFYAVSPLSLLANMVVVPLAFVIFLAGMIFFAVFWLGKAVFFVPLAVKLLIEAFVRWLSVVDGLPGAYVITGKLNGFLWVALVLGIVWIFWTPRIQKNFTRAAALCLFALGVFTAQDIARSFDRHFRMTVLDVGQGEAIFMEFPGGNLLVDAGKGGDSDKGRLVVEPFLKSKGVRSIDLLVLSHPQEDHIGGMGTVLEEFRVRRVLDAGRPYSTKLYEWLKTRIAAEKALLLPLEKNLFLFKKVSIEVLNPDPRAAPYANINNDSVVLRLTYGATSFLLTGDIESEAIQNILDSGKNVQAHVLKVPHHGAKEGEAGNIFFQKVAPQISAISVGARNPFGHPKPETLKVLESVPGNAVYRTDRQGAVEIISDGREVQAVPFISSSL